MTQALETSNLGKQHLMGEVTVDALEFADPGEVQIRGKVEPVRVWAVVR